MQNKKSELMLIRRATASV